MSFVTMMNKDTYCDDNVVTLSDIVVITVYNVYVCISLVKLVYVFFSLFSAYLVPVSSFQ